MGKVIFMSVFLLILSACAPIGQTVESWGRSVFAPSEISFRKACIASLDTLLGKDIGEVSFDSAKGKISFISAPGHLGFYCQPDIGFTDDRNSLNSFLNSQDFKDFMADSSAFFVVYTQKNMTDVAAYVSLEDDNGVEFAQLISNDVEGVIPGFRYNFTQLSTTDIENIARASSFSLIVNRGFGEEKFRVTPDNLDPFKLN